MAVSFLPDEQPRSGGRVGLLVDLLEFFLGSRHSALPEPVGRSAERTRHRRMVREHLASSPLLHSTAVEGGRVALQGRAVSRDLLTAPGSGKRVIGYRLRLSRCLPRGELAPILDVAQVGSFALDDGGPVPVEVRPVRCLPLLTAEPPTLCEADALRRPPLSGLLERHADSGSALTGADRYRLTEHLLEEGEPVFIFGLARRVVDASGAPAGYRGTLFRLVVDPPEEGLLVVADRQREALLAALDSSEDIVPDW